MENDVIARSEVVGLVDGALKDGTVGDSDGALEAAPENGHSVADKTVTGNFELLPTPQPPLLSGRIAFYSNWDGNDEIYVMNADGSGRTPLTNQQSDAGIPPGLQTGTG